MSDELKKKFVMRNAAIRERIVAFLYELPFDTVPEGWSVVIRPEKVAKSTEQERKYHAMLDDIRMQHKFVFQGKVNWPKEVVKAILKDAFARVKAEIGEPLKYQAIMMPSLDGKGIVTIPPSSKEFTIDEASDFIEFLYQYGTERNVKWSEKYRD